MLPKPAWSTVFQVSQAYRDIKNLTEKIKLHGTLVVPSDRTINNTFARVATELGMKLLSTMPEPWICCPTPRMRTLANPSTVETEI